MLKKITLENFKGFGSPVTLPIRPLTVIFGKNSSGKSTLVQALHYAREVLVFQNPNADRTSAGGSSIELGGFRNIVHKRDLSRPIKIRIDTDISDFGMPSYSDPYEHMYTSDQDAQRDFLSEKEKAILDASQAFQSEYRGNTLERAMYECAENGDSIATAMSVEFTVSWDSIRELPIISRYETTLAGEPASRIITNVEDGTSIVEVNLNNRMLYRIGEDKEVARRTDEANWVGDLVRMSKSPVPQWMQGVSVIRENVPLGVAIGAQTLSELLVAPGEVAVFYLERFMYVGPLRAIPSRGYQPLNTKGDERWAAGLGAWDELYRNEEGLVAETGKWLGKDGLKTGFTLEMESFREIPTDSFIIEGNVKDLGSHSPVELKSELNKYPVKKRLTIVEEKSQLRLSPLDVGVGISQVIPVIAAALDAHNKVIAVEQPELHLHPAVQAELGDLFIYSAISSLGLIGPGRLRPAGLNTCIVETHSEHLILRILRRIRESSRGKNTVQEVDICPDDLALLFVGGVGENGENTIISLSVDEQGRIVDPVPGGFFEEDFAEVF